MITPYNPKKDIAPFYPTVIDIETNSNGDVIGVGMAWNDGESNRVYMCESWDDWYLFYSDLLRKNKRSVRLRKIYAHNGANFDWLSFIHWAHSRKLIDKCEYKFSGSFGIGIDLHISGVVVKLRDSYKLLPASLDALSKTFDTPHQKKDIDMLPAELKEVNSDMYWDYLANDLLSLQEILFSFWTKIYDAVGTIGELPMTLPALSTKLWRMTIDRPIMTPKNKKLKALERRSYKGGRTECFQVGTDNVNVYDANSEYPYIMLNYECPISYTGAWTRVYKGKDGIYDVEYEQLDTFHKPVLRDEMTGKFQYKGSGVFTKPELDKLLKMGGAIKVKRGYIYTDMGKPFEAFIEQWWGMRQDALQRGDAAFAFVCKILMNSLYGKFGQKEVGFTIKMWTADEQIQALKDGKKFKVFDDFSLVEEERFSEVTFVGIASYITSNARLWLYDKMCEMQDSGATLWACDTDSVHASGAESITSKELGQWKLEYQGEATYLGPKLYAQKDGAIKAKGVSLKHVNVGYQDFYDLAHGVREPMKVTFPTFPTFRHVLLNGDAPCRVGSMTRTIKPTTAN